MIVSHPKRTYLFLLLFQCALVVTAAEVCFAQSDVEGEIPASKALKLQSASLFIGPSSMQTRTSGSGFTASQPAALGTNFGAVMQVKATPLSLTFVAHYSLSQSNQDVATGLTPNKIAVKKEELNVHGLNESVFKDAWYSFRIGVGYKFQKYEADQTKPNVVVTTQTTQGLYFALNKVMPLQDSSNIEFDFKLHLPNRVHEDATSTGTNPSFLGTEIQLVWHRSFRANWNYTIGAKLQYDQASYTGVGARGTNSADDVRSNFNLPIGIEYNF